MSTAKRGEGGDKWPLIARHAFSPSSPLPPPLGLCHLPPLDHVCDLISVLVAQEHTHTMAEKRKLPPRAGREPAAKRRVSAAATPQSSKKKAPTPRVPTPPPPEPVEAPLPAKVRDGEPLPITSAPQPANLSDQEYQSVAERYDLAFAAKAYRATNIYFYSQRRTFGIFGAIKKEVAERRRPRPILHEAEEDETRTDCAEQPTEGVDVEAWPLRCDHRPSSL